MNILKLFTKSVHHSYGDDYRECDSCSYDFKHKLLIYPPFGICEHSGECPLCGTESIHEVEEWEVAEYMADAEYNAKLDDKCDEVYTEDCPMTDEEIEQHYKQEMKEMDKCDESYIKKHS